MIETIDAALIKIGKWTVEGADRLKITDKVLLVSWVFVGSIVQMLPSAKGMPPVLFVACAFFGAMLSVPLIFFVLMNYELVSREKDNASELLFLSSGDARAVFWIIVILFSVVHEGIVLSDLSVGLCSVKIVLCMMFWPYLILPRLEAKKAEVPDQGDAGSD